MHGIVQRKSKESVESIYRSRIVPNRLYIRSMAGRDDAVEEYERRGDVLS